MLEGLAAWVLNTYVGEYVENLNTDQLSIGLLQGAVELDNLPLKKDALRKFDLPLEVKSGFIGHIRLQIPVSRLKSEPWVISMEKLYLVAGPLNKDKYDEEKEKKAQQDRKDAQLKEMEEKWKAESGQTQTGGSTGYSSWWGYGASLTGLATNIMENIQLNVEDVHIRYEDDITVPSCPFACGFVIKSLAAQSTDDGWVPRFVSRHDTDMMHKLLDLQNLSVYWDVNAEMMGNISNAELMETLKAKESDAVPLKANEDHQFLLEPVSAQAKVKRNTSSLPLRSANTPRIHMDMKMDKIAVSLDETQYRTLVAWMKEISRHDKARKYRKWRPHVPVKDNAKVWWQFAIQARLHFIKDKNKRLSKDYLISRARYNVLYTQAYEEYLLKGDYYMDPTLKRHMTEMEEEWTFEEAKILRQIVHDKLAAQNRVAQEALSPSDSKEALTPSPSESVAPSPVMQTPLTTPPTTPSPTSDPQQSAQQQGLFQRWFPGWGGWYGYGPTEGAPATTPTSPPLASTPTQPDQHLLSDKQIEQEILDVLTDSAEDNTLLKRDIVLAQLNFCLQSATFKLCSNTSQSNQHVNGSDHSSSLLELECSTVKIGFESRPRSHGLQFSISLGSLHLRDKMTPGSILPVLISPQARDRGGHGRQFFGGMLGNVGGKTSVLQPAGLLGQAAPQVDNTLFSLTYERKPLHSTADYRLSIKTKPLDIVYNANTIKRISEFFTVKQSGSSSHREELQLAVAAKRRYEQIKRQTQAELKQTLDELLEGDDKIKAKRWDVDLDISAPQFILPDNFTDQNATLVVFDLGQLHVHNTNNVFNKQTAPENADDDEDFVTPCSTPGEVEVVEESASVSDMFSADLTEASIHERLYDKYTLSLSELQVMVGHAKDNWKFAHNKGTSHMHVIDKFSISLQLERRLLYTSEAQWPKMTLSGTLPSLLLHVNEQKISALRMCGNMFSSTTSPTSETSGGSMQSLEDTASNFSQDNNKYKLLSKSIISLSETVDQQTKQAVAESRLLLMQFSINQMTLDIQSRGRNIAELQVGNMQATFTRRPYDTSISFTVHSLLVVDALQTYGQDFELLVASHKNLCLDSQSGSIMGSDPNSPLSPRSPVSPSSPVEEDPPKRSTSFHTVQAAVSSALQSLVNKTSAGVATISPFSSVMGGMMEETTLTVDSEALIRMEIDIISPNCPTNTSHDETLQIANIQFNSLDIVANQQTIVELLSFFKRVSPEPAEKPPQSSKSKEETVDYQSQSAPSLSTRTEVTADFHRLNVLLMRAEEREQTIMGCKVATATLSKAKIQATIADDMQLEGSLGGLQLLDLTQEGTTSSRHMQKVFSVGHDPNTSFNTDLVARMACLSNTSIMCEEDVQDEDDDVQEKAFTFKLFRPEQEDLSRPESPVGLQHSQVYGGFGGEEKEAPVELTLRMASLCYTHSPSFLRDLSFCVSDFKGYMSQVGTAVKHAATEVALGLVHKRSEFLATSLYGSTHSLDAAAASTARLRTTSVSTDNQEDEPEQADRPLNLQLDIVLQTPVVLLPRRPRSPDVLVAHLGRITIQNSLANQHPTSTFNESLPQVDDHGRDRMYMEIKDMSMYSMNLDKQKALHQQAQKGSSLNTSVFSTPQPGGYVQTSYGTPILHDTAVELIIEKVEPDENYINPGDTAMDMDSEFKRTKQNHTGLETTLQVDGKIVTPLQLVLSKSVYEQILQTLDNLTPDDDVPPPTSSASFTGLSNISEENQDANSLSSGSDVRLDKPLSIQANFEMPKLNIQMLGDLGEGEQGLVDIHLQDFKVKFTKDNPYSKSFEVCLQSLLIEDLLQSPHSRHRNLMESSSQADLIAQGLEKSAPAEVPQYLSASCPTSMIDIPQPNMPQSLPSSFHRQNVFDAHIQQQQKSAPTRQTSRTPHRSKSESGGCPCTPPPSPTQSHDETTFPSQPDYSNKALVRISVTLVDKKFPEFVTKYNNTHRFIDVNFNCLDTTINLQTWVLLLEFLGMGAKVHDPADYTEEAQTARANADTRTSLPTQDGQEVVNSEINLNMQRLSLTLNKQEYELASTDISKFSSHISLRDGNFHIAGQLGSITLTDQSPHGQLYRERFMTTGTQALDFDILKYGLPDPDLMREQDIRIRLRMGSVRYIHTQRFLQEVLAFVQHFQQLQDVLGRMRAASAGQKITETAFRGSRMSFDIDAGAPIILIPHSSRSTDVLVMDLGTLTVRNSFHYAGSEQTIAGRKLVLSGDIKESESVQSFGSDSTVRADTGSEAGTLGQSVASGSSESFLGNSMSQSVYGSLDTDWRSDSMESSDLFSGFRSPTSTSSKASFYSSPGKPTSPSSVQGSSSLSSFYSTVGSVPSSSIIGGSSSHHSFHSASFSHTASPPQQQQQQQQVVSPSEYCCLLDVMQVSLMDMDLFSAVWVSSEDFTAQGNQYALQFPSFAIVHDAGGKLLREKCRLDLQVERNLEGDISHNVPDFCVEGGLSLVYCSIDLEQYKLVRGLLEHNLGEPLEQFERPMMSHLQDPNIQTVISGSVWKSMSISIALNNVTVELLKLRQPCSTSLAKLDFNKSRLTYESFSDGSKDVDLVSHEIVATDTRFTDAPANARPNVFTNILAASKDRSRPDALQMELHYRSTKEFTRFTILLNNMRLMGILDWLLSVKEFLLTSAENPFKKDHSNEGNSSSSMSNSTYGVSGGIMTKRAPIMDKVETPFELKLNVTDTELVVVENAALWDTNAVILKSTAVLSLRPSSKERPLSCSLQSLEVFSCSLAAEDETALSIIDPMNVTMELNNSPLTHQRTSGSPSGLLDAYSDQDKPPVLEVGFGTLNIRLSYNDLKLFLAILNSLPKQASEATSSNQPKNVAKPVIPASQIRQLEDLGFSQGDCEQALVNSKGDVNEAAMWLTQHATPVSHSKSASKKPPGGGGLSLSGVEIKAGLICFCLIDDCLDADIPLAELTFSNVHFLQRFDSFKKGKANFKLRGDFYNRTLSGWEPFLEYWGCRVEWEASLPNTPDGRLSINITASEVLNFNVTSVLLDQYKKTKAKWTEDYYNTEASDVSLLSHRRRLAFIPFALRNETGCKMWFATVTTTPTRISLASSGEESSEDGRPRANSQYELGEWMAVYPGDTRTFMFEEREKIRHKHTHELKVHQVLVKVEGWKEVTPVSVDRVGVYFRQASPEVNSSSSIFIEMPPARIVFDVTLEGSARKLITVRSALMIENQLDDGIELKLDNADMKRGDRLITLDAGKRLCIPMPLVSSRMWVRPTGWSLDFSSKPIHWHHVLKKGEVNDSIRTCNTTAGEAHTYRMCVSVYRQAFPEELPANHVMGGSSQHNTVFIQPGHVITIMPAVRIVNLLPVDITYYFNNTDIKGTIKPGKMAPISAADVSTALELGVFLENFPQCKELIIPPGTTDYKVRMRLYDIKNRLLELYVYIKSGIGGSLKLSIWSPYWLVNKSGLPLVFRQDNAKQDAAGQFEEHELARSVTPLLFSYADKDANYLCSMRIGRSVHGPGTVPQWCYRFSPERGIGVRQLHVVPRDQRPDWVYNIGIDVRQGRGRYRDTTIVTFSPRYQLDNRTRYKLAFAQRHFTRGQSTSGESHLSALAGCKLSFHWPRLDLDQLLCVRIMDITTCQWSGGFRVDQVNSFHINMRGEQSENQFLRVDIVLQGATFFIVFTDADHMPPPYRIDNFSEVPVLYFQTKVVEERLRTYIKPRSSLPYAWDEPTLPPHITLSVQGGNSVTYSMNCIADGEQLCYENFIYIIFEKTFRGDIDSKGGSKGYDEWVQSQQLVLDVITTREGTHKVVLRKKEKGRRSQLWRMTSTGMLQHEGTSSPSDPRTSSGSRSRTGSISGLGGQVYVLDIEGLALQPDRDHNLILKKPDTRRKYTQTWHFQDGRLCCEAVNMCVQAKDGFHGLRDGGEGVLGPYYSLRRGEVQPEMHVGRHRLRPGSGILLVKVITDGPTRVLQISDINQQDQLSPQSPLTDEWVIVSEGHSPERAALSIPGGKQAERSPSESQTLPSTWQVVIRLPAGVGISLVNHVPEELIYISLDHIEIEYTTSPAGIDLEATVGSLQIDNQLYGALRQVLLYQNTKSPSSTTVVEPKPALHVSVQKMPTNVNWNADIYRHLIVSLQRFTIQIEERLLWKLLQFMGYNKSDAELEKLDENHVDSQRAILAATSKQFKRYYFGTLKINTSRMTMSMLTSRELAVDLKAIKKRMGIPLIKFEDAKVELDPFVKIHPFETSAFLLETISLHYTEELKSQAAKILGSVDFLGNPLGLFNDVTEGISGLLKDGNVGGLLKNVTHGVSNSAAKVTGSLSDGMGLLTADTYHEQTRQRIRGTAGVSSSGHLVAGIKGFGHGILGGLTSIATQTYSGVKHEGFEGLFTGFGKGVVGTVTKPVAGVLDLASATASAVRDTSKGSNRIAPDRKRLPRCCHGPGDVLPAFSTSHARAQEFLVKLSTDSAAVELFITSEPLRLGKDDSLRALLSSQQVCFLGRGGAGTEVLDLNNVVLKVPYDELYHCRSFPYEDKFYLELTMKADNERGVPATDARKRPKVRCDSEAISRKVAQQINYAKNLYDETKQTLPAGSIFLTED